LANWKYGKRKFATNGQPSRGSIDGDYLYLADGDAGLTVVNIAK
jgi:hypothetical protein